MIAIIGISHHLFFIASPYLIVGEWNYQTFILYAFVLVKYVNDAWANHFWFLATLFLAVIFGVAAWFFRGSFFFFPSAYYAAITIYDSVNFKDVYYQRNHPVPGILARHRSWFGFDLALFMLGNVIAIIYRRISIGF